MCVRAHLSTGRNEVEKDDRGSPVSDSSRDQSPAQSGAGVTARALLADRPDLETVATAARERLGARLNYLEAAGVSLGRKPWWWQENWP